MNKENERYLLEKGRCSANGRRSERETEVMYVG